MKALYILLICLFSVSVYAQRHTPEGVCGKIYDASLLDPLEGATIQVFDTLGTFLGGAATRSDGFFQIRKKMPAICALKVSFMGYKAQNLRLNLEGKKGMVRVKDILLEEDVVMMNEARVEGRASEMTVQGDTLIYHASLYRLPAGSTLSDLLRRMPGISDQNQSGGFTVNGRQIDRILLNGKAFYGDDIRQALKYLPPELVDRIRVYEKKSDETEWTGTDDGRRETVLDLSVSKDVQESWLGEARLGYGSSNRYEGQASLNRFHDRQYVSMHLNGHNLSDLGEEENQNAGLSLNLSRKKFSLNGSVSFFRNNMEQSSQSNRQYLDNEMTSYTYTEMRQHTDNKNLNMNYSLEWRPDTMTQVLYQPTFSWAKSLRDSHDGNATFYADPYNFLQSHQNPLDHLDLLPDSIKINRSRNSVDATNSSLSFQHTLFVNRRFRKEGRTVSLMLRNQFNSSEDNGTDVREVDYYALSAVAGGDSLYRSRQNDQTKNGTQGWGMKLTYSEPVGHEMTLQFSYQLNLQSQKYKRSVFALPFDGQDEQTMVWDSLQYQDTRNNYREQIGEVGLNVTRTKYFLNLGVMMLHQYSEVDLKRYLRRTQAHQNQVNWAPRVYFNYNLTSRKQVGMTYSAYSRPVDILRLIPDTLDLSDPLNVQVGNPELKPQLMHSLHLTYNSYSLETMRSYNVNLNAQYSQNSISSHSQYDPLTGKRTTKPVNVDGNMSMGANASMNSPLKNNRFTVNLSSDIIYTRAVGFVEQQNPAGVVRNVTNSWMFHPTFGISYRDRIMDGNLQLMPRYDRMRNSSVSAGNMDTYGLDSRLMGMVMFSWNMDLSTDFNFNMRRGLSSQDMNANEWVWNIQVAQKLCKNKLQLILKACDLLDGRNNSNRYVTYNSRNDVSYQTFGRYFLFKVLYKFTLPVKKTPSA